MIFCLWVVLGWLAHIFYVWLRRIRNVFAAFYLQTQTHCRTNIVVSLPNNTTKIKTGENRFEFLVGGIGLEPTTSTMST